MASTTLGNGSVTFGDGTVQTTKTPSVVSAFTNDNGFIISSAVSATYATKSNAIGSIEAYGNGGHMAVGLTWYDINGNTIGSGYWNCNCNCNC